MKTKKKPRGYRGKLSISEVVEGMNVAEKNAFRLITDSSILFDSKRYPSALALALLAIEELGKVIILRMLATASLDSERIELWNNYRTHLYKNKWWRRQLHSIIDVHISKDPKSFDSEITSESIEQDLLKQLCFYSDCLNKDTWWNPSEIIDESVAKNIIDYLKIFINNTKHTKKEIELYCLYIGPFWRFNKPPDWKKYIDALKRENISPSVVIGLHKSNFDDPYQVNFDLDDLFLDEDFYKEDPFHDEDPNPET